MGEGRGTATFAAQVKSPSIQIPDLEGKKEDQEREKVQSHISDDASSTEGVDTDEKEKAMVGEEGIDWGKPADEPGSKRRREYQAEPSSLPAAATGSSAAGSSDLPPLLPLLPPAAPGGSAPESVQQAEEEAAIQEKEAMEDPLQVVLPLLEEGG